MVKSNQKFPKFKNFPSKGGGSQNLGTVPKLYLVINYDGFPKHVFGCKKSPDQQASIGAGMCLKDNITILMPKTSPHHENVYFQFLFWKVPCLFIKFLQAISSPFKWFSIELL